MIFNIINASVELPTDIIKLIISYVYKYEFDNVNYINICNDKNFIWNKIHSFIDLIKIQNSNKTLQNSNNAKNIKTLIFDDLLLQLKKYSNDIYLCGLDFVKIYNLEHVKINCYKSSSLTNFICEHIIFYMTHSTYELVTSSKFLISKHFNVIHNNKFIYYMKKKVTDKYYAFDIPNTKSRIIIGIVRDISHLYEIIKKNQILNICKICISLSGLLVYKKYLLHRYVNNLSTINNIINIKLLINNKIRIRNDFQNVQLMFEKMIKYICYLSIKIFYNTKTNFPHKDYKINMIINHHEFNVFYVNEDHNDYLLIYQNYHYYGADKEHSFIHKQNNDELLINTHVNPQIIIDNLSYLDQNILINSIINELTVLSSINLLHMRTDEQNIISNIMINNNYKKIINELQKCGSLKIDLSTNNKLFNQCYFMIIYRIFNNIMRKYSKIIKEILIRKIITNYFGYIDNINNAPKVYNDSLLYEVINKDYDNYLDIVIAYKS